MKSPKSIKDKTGHKPISRYLEILSVLTISASLMSAALLPIPANAAERKAVFAGGCFWCMEEAYEKVTGVSEVVSGFSGGRTKDPTYRKVTGGDTGHYEVVEVVYDDSIVTYDELLSVFWANIDPLDDGGQFCDRGSSYKSAIFYQNRDERRAANDSLRRVEEFLNERVVTPVLEFDEFYAAEQYHQDFYKKNPIRYRFYKSGCGRPARLDRLGINIEPSTS